MADARGKRWMDPLTDLLPFGKNPEPKPDPGTVKPPANQRPAGQSGRVNFGGFIQFDETNRKLVGNFGLKQFDEIYFEDPDIRRNVAALWTPILAANWSIEPYGGDEATDADRLAAELAHHAIFRHMSPNWLGHLAVVGPVLIRSGFAPFEQIWQTTQWKGKTVTIPRKLDLRLPRTIWRWFQDDNGDLVSIEQFLPNASNVNIPASELTYYRLQAEGDNWTGRSLLRQAYKPWFYKSHFERLDAIGQERKAVGVPIVYPPQSAADETRQEVEEMLANLHVNEVGYMMMPGPKAGTSGLDASEGWTVEVVKFDSSSGETIQASITMQKQAIAGAFLADFLELGHHQVGARATAQVQEDPFLTAVGALATEIKIPGDELVRRIAMLNVPGIEGPPRLKFALSDAASLSEISTYAAGLIACGAMQTDPELEDYFRERADFPAANPEVRKKEAERREKLQKAEDEAVLNPPPVQPALMPGAPRGNGGSPKKQPGVPGSHGTPAGSPPKVMMEGDGGPLPDETDEEEEPEQETAAWWEKMLSQGKLVEALDGARERIQQAALPATVALARLQAQRGSSGRTLSPLPPDDLVEALTAHMFAQQQIGYRTVIDELEAQRAHLGRPGPGDAQLRAAEAAALAALLVTARKRGKSAASTVTAEINRAVERAAILGLTTADAQRAAESAASDALRREAVANASTTLNEGRALAARGEGEVIGGIYTSVLDPNTCDNCQIADDGIVRPVGDPQLEVPNPVCDGGERCRCFVVWVLTNEPLVP